MTRLKSIARSGRPDKYPWSTIGAALIAAYRSGTSEPALAKTYAIPVGTIHSFLQRNNVQHDSRIEDRWHSIGKAVLHDYKNGASSIILSKRYKIPVGSICKYLNKHGVSRSRKAAVQNMLQCGHRSTKWIARKERVCAACTYPYMPASASQRYCKNCIPHRRHSQIYRRYGLTHPQLVALLCKQNGRCALCINTPTVVDHDHKTMVVRGLLCGFCNQVLNRVETPEWIAHATRYLKNDTGYRADPHQTRDRRTRTTQA